MVSCLTLMPVISVKAFANVLDSYSWVVIVSETMLMSMFLKGSAALMNHCISFIWSSFDRVDGWNSLSIHFFAAASSARAGAVIAAEAAISANALVIIKIRVLEGPSLLFRCRIWFLRCSDRQSQARVDPGSVFFARLDRAENDHGDRERNCGCEPQAREFKSFLAHRQGCDGVGADEADPQQMDDGRQDQRDEQTVAARRGDPQGADALGF